MLPEIVSRETMVKLDLYFKLLEKWQAKINLISAETLPDAQERHFNDSLQLLQHIPPQTKTLHDWGSGGGFPGLVLAIARPDIAVTLIESDQRKCAFLRTVARETGTKVKILDERIETVQPDPTALPDLITARALATLEKLSGWAMPWTTTNPALTMLFLKGETAAQEIEAAQKNYTFAIEQFPSTTKDDSVILRLSRLSTI